MSSPPLRCPNCGSLDVENFRCNSCGHSIESIASSWTCPQCGFNNREESKFCGHCGVSLVRYCPQCGGRIPLSAPICEHCGIDCERILVSSERCQRCGFENDAHAKCCAQCGARLLVKCPECGTMARATLNFCAHCGFGYSQFVTQKVIEILDSKQLEEKEPVHAMSLSSGIMIGLVIFSIIIVIYILQQL